MFEDRINDAVVTATNAFWMEVSRQFPEVKYGDLAPGEADAFDREAKAIIRSWLRNMPPLEYLYALLEDEGFAPTWGDEGGGSLWVALEWPAERFDRRIEVRHSDLSGFELTLQDPEGEFYVGTGFEDSRFGDAAVTVAAILTFARITRTCFEYDTEVR